MYENVSEEEAKDRIEEMVHDCADNGNRYTILRLGVPVAHLIPYEEYKELSEKAWMYEELE